MDDISQPSTLNNTTCLTGSLPAVGLGVGINLYYFTLYMGWEFTDFARLLNGVEIYPQPLVLAHEC